MYLYRTIFNGKRRTCPFIRFHAHEYIQSRETVGLLYVKYDVCIPRRQTRNWRCASVDARSPAILGRLAESCISRNIPK